jgi:dTDP-glucose 4,6-dehydratase
LSCHYVRRLEEADGRRIDLGFVGKVTSVNSKLVTLLCQADTVPVIAPLARDSAGQKLNCNADTAAGEVAAAMKAEKQAGGKAASARRNMIHLAALSPVRLSFERPFEYEKVNYLGTMNVAHALMDLPDYRKRKMIAASTAEVYGIHTHGRPLKEEDQLNPSSPYSVSKAAADMYLRMAARAYELNAVILRPVNTFGRKFETNFMVEYLITTMLRKERVYVGAPDSIREYIYVDDHTGGYLAAMEKGVQGEVYNISTGEGMKNREITERIAKMIGYDGSKIVLGAYPPGYPVRPAISDQPYIILDPNKARNELGWRQKTSLDEGLKKTISHWRSFMEERSTT